MMKTMLQRRYAGVTLTELLVVLLIISILSTIAVPVYVNHSERARISAAQEEVRNLAEAEETVGVLYGYYVPLQLLDDVPGDSSTSFINSDTDAIGLESTSINLIDITSSLSELSSQPTLGRSDVPRVRKLLRDWEGPFMSFQRVFIGDAASNDPANLTGSLIRYDYPLDPWGQPYRFYSPLGIIGSSAISTVPSSWNSQSFGDGNVTRTNDRFDRFAIVSYGPDGVSGITGGVLASDDIIYEFGRLVIDRETDFAP